MDWNDFSYDEPSPERKPDEYVISAYERLKGFFEKNNTRVFFGNQLAVQNEDSFFHWVTYRAVGQLIDEGTIKTEARELSFGGEIKLLWHRSHRYYKRDAKKVVSLVEEYGSPNIGGALGLHGEQMILAGFARRKFVLRGHNTKRFMDSEWTKTNHNMDFVFERDDLAYGAEVKNTLSYMDQSEFATKLDLCEHLRVAPVFVVRMMPKTWVKELIDHGGFAMILKYQLYPWTHTELAKRVSRELGLPVDAPRALAEGTMERFVNWHEKRRKA